jgi:hypothetical protein
MPYIEFSNPVNPQRSSTLLATNRFSMKSLFSNNSLVYYKPGSYTVSTGTVRNSSTTSKRT